MEPTNGNGTLALAVKAIGAAILFIIISTTYLISTGHDVPEGMIAMGAGAVGALSTLLNHGGQPK